MAPPSAVQESNATPPDETTSGLVKSGVAHNVQKTAASLTAANGSLLSDHLLELDASKLTINRNPYPKEVPDPNSIEAWSNAVCSDHMLTASWDVKSGWHAPVLQPYGPLSLMPTASCLHYATECFEGLKVYRGDDRKLRLFRPDLNASRMLMSSLRIALPAFPPRELAALITKLCAFDGPRWLPKDRPGKFMYLRPTLISNAPGIGVAKPKEALLFIIMCSIPDFGAIAHQGTGRKKPGMRLLASRDDMCRAWPGGFGYAKVGANYGPSLVAQAEATSRGYDHILWLFGEKNLVTEAGACNFFVVWENSSGQKELVTAPLDGKLILDGVTRRSIIDLARERLSDELSVVERDFTMEEIELAVREQRLVEAFVVGTAVFVASVNEIHFRGKDLEVPLADGTMGKYTKLFKTTLEDIKYGRTLHPWGVVVDEIEETQMNGTH